MRHDNRLTRWLLRGRGPAARLMTRKCRGCADPSPHDAHLTRFGHRFLDRRVA